MHVRIYQPAKSAMQSGRANTREWVLEFAPGQRQMVDPLMGWTGAGDTRRQLRLKFTTVEEAVAYAQKHGLAYVMEAPHQRRLAPKAYADNFRADRVLRWTH